MLTYIYKEPNNGQITEILFLKTLTQRTSPGSFSNYLAIHQDIERTLIDLVQWEPKYIYEIPIRSMNALKPVGAPRMQNCSMANTVDGEAEFDPNWAFL